MSEQKHHYRRCQRCFEILELLAGGHEVSRKSLLEQARQGEILLLFEDETIVILFGELGSSWSPRGGKHRKCLRQASSDVSLLLGQSKLRRDACITE